MRRWTLLSRAERGGVILSGAWTTSTCYKPREIERACFVAEFSSSNLVSQKVRRGIGHIPQHAVIDRFDIPHPIQLNHIHEPKGVDGGTEGDAPPPDPQLRTRPPPHRPRGDLLSLWPAIAG